MFDLSLKAGIVITSAKRSKQMELTPRYYVYSYINKRWVEVPYQVYLDYEGDKKVA